MADWKKNKNLKRFALLNSNYLTEGAEKETRRIFDIANTNDSSSSTDEEGFLDKAKDKAKDLIPGTSSGEENDPEEENEDSSDDSLLDKAKDKLSSSKEDDKDNQKEEDDPSLLDKAKDTLASDDLKDAKDRVENVTDGKPLETIKDLASGDKSTINDAKKEAMGFAKDEEIGRAHV